MLRDGGGREGAFHRPGAPPASAPAGWAAGEEAAAAPWGVPG